jgi:hypothetical protein
VKPQSVRAEQELAGAAPPDSFHQILEAADARCVGVHVGVTTEAIHDALVGPEIVREGCPSARR